MTNRMPIRRTAIAVLATLLLSGCAIFRTPPPLTPDRAFAMGMEAFEAGRHRRAAELLSTFVIGSTADPRMREALMALAESRMAMREYLTAATDYLRVVTEFPADPAAIDARFGLCEAYHRLSPRPQLDQQHTYTAITYCESYAQFYPESPRAQQAREWVAGMHETLAEKAYLNGVYYFRRGLFDSAIIYFNEAVEAYPQTRAAPQALLMLVRSYERLGYREDAAAARERLLREFPGSAEARELAG